MTPSLSVLSLSQSREATQKRVNPPKYIALRDRERTRERDKEREISKPP